MKYEWVDYRESGCSSIPHIDLIDPATTLTDPIVQIFKDLKDNQWSIYIKGYDKEYPWEWQRAYSQDLPPQHEDWDDLKIKAEEFLGTSRKLFTGDISFEI